MTPNDIATSVTSLGSAGQDGVKWSTTPTYCFSGGNWVADDQRSWD
ncbi:MAG: hypothetical protein IKO55_06610 [Kiritimatiellae bacterium]|nr:hypothetical protein [Kiritimatiellia bacterium]